MEISSCSGPHRIRKVTLHAEFSRQLINTAAGELDPDRAWHSYNSVSLASTSTSTERAAVKIPYGSPALKCSGLRPSIHSPILFKNLFEKNAEEL